MHLTLSVHGEQFDCTQRSARLYMTHGSFVDAAWLAHTWRLDRLYILHSVLHEYLWEEIYVVFEGPSVQMQCTSFEMNIIYTVW